MECHYIIKFNGKAKRFNTDEQLDSWIYENRDALLQGIFDFDVISELSPLQIAYNKVQVANNNSRSISKDEYTTVTGVWGQINPRTLELKKKYEEIKVEVIAKEQKVSIEEAKKIFKEEQALNKSDKIGTAFHKILELKALDKNLGKDSDSGYDLSTDQFKLDRETADSFFRDIDRKFGKRGVDYIILPEQNIFSDRLNPEKAEILYSILGRHFKYILGKADLVLITKNGDIHIFDYKTSSRNLGKNWYETDINTIKAEGSYSTFTRDEYEAQILSYAAMYKHNGFKNVTPHLVKFHRNNDGHIDKYEGIVDFKASSRVASNINALFDIEASSNITQLKDVSDQMVSLFGDNSSVTKKSEGFKRNADYFMRAPNFLKEVDPNSEKGKLGFTWFFNDSILNDLVYIKGSRDDARPAVEKYVERLNKAASTENLKLGQDLAKVKNKLELENLCRLISPSKWENVYRIFEKYISQGWKFTESDLLNGNGIFLFQRGGRSEIVMVESADPLHKKLKLNKGTSVLGNFFSDDEFGVDNRFYLDASVGNLLLIKAISFISNDQEFFKQKRVSGISVVNPLTGEAITNTPLSVLVKNWNTLSLFKRNLKLRPIGEDDLVYSDVDSAINRARDYVSTISGYKTDLKLFTLPKSEVDYTEKEILEILHNLEWIQGKLSDTSDWRLKLAYSELYKALLYIHGRYHITTENDVSEYLSGGLFFSGGFFAPMALSPSANLRTLNELSITFHNKIAQESEKIIAEWQNKLKNIWKKEYENIFGGQWKLFENWFQTENGELDRRFLLKDPRSDSYFKQHPEEADLCKFFLDELAKLRWGEDKWESHIGTEAYLEVPLCEPISNWEIIDSEGFGQGSLKIAKKKIRDLIQVTTETLNGKRTDTSKYKDSDLNITKIPNPYFDEGSANERQNMLNDKRYGPGYFEKNLDVVFLNAVISGVKSKLSTTFMPLFTGLRVLLSIENTFNKADMNSIAHAVDTYIGTVVLNRSQMDDSLQPLNKLLGQLKGIVSKLTLGLSSKNYIRELAGSTIRTAWMNFTKDPRFNEFFHYEDYAKALKEMLTNSKQAFVSNSKDMQLNTKFRSANMSYFEMAESLRSGKYGLSNLETQFFFMTSTLPDFIHRNAVLKATLIYLGAYDAYEMKNNILIYDWTKDKRFDILFKYATNGVISENDYSKISNKEDLKKWNEQSNLYKDSLLNWTKAGEYLKYGDPLPEALDPVQQNTFKTQTDILYGNYDNESKSLMQRTLLGSMFFQFKTYGISRMIEWWKRGGSINIILPKIMYDENGEKIYKRLSTEAEMLQGAPPFTYIRESEITDEDWNNNRIEVAKDFIGASNEGRAQSLYRYGVAWNNAEEMERLWKDPFKRANLYNSIHDIWLWVLLAGLIRLLYGDEIIETMNEQDWWTRWTYAVVMGIAQDGPIWEVAKSLWSDGQIPMFSAISKYFSTAMSVINGNTYVWNGVLNSFGATREFSNLIEEI